MNRIQQLFSEKKNNILSIYFTAGFPNLNDTVVLIEELQRAGADMIEIGIPFSDPLADGPVIQRSSEVALKNGMNLKLLLEQLQTAHCKLPTLLMSYFNPVLQFGISKFCEKASECGIAGVIIPDLPMPVYLDEYKPVFEKYGIINVFLITPQTSEERIRLIDEYSNGFIYMVSSSSTTGIKAGINNEQEVYFSRIKNMRLKNPVMIGFGISDKRSFDIACEFANGAIIGSAFIKQLIATDYKLQVGKFIQSIKSSSNEKEKV